MGARRTAIVVVGSGLLFGVAVACGGGSDADVEAGRPQGFEATPGYLAEAVEESDAIPRRVEGTMDIRWGQRSLEELPVTTGAIDGERHRIRYDVSEMYEEWGGALGQMQDLDATIEVASDGTTLYMRAPTYGAFAEGVIGPADPSITALATTFKSLGDAWGRVDVARIRDAGGNGLGAIFRGGPTMDPTAFLESLHDTRSVEDLGVDEIAGDPVAGLSATLPAGDIEVWFDGAGLVRRLRIDMTESYRAMNEAAGKEIPSGGVALAYTFDFLDYGDESIVVEMPVTAVFVFWRGGGSASRT